MTIMACPAGEGGGIFTAGDERQLISMADGLAAVTLLGGPATASTTMGDTVFIIAAVCAGGLEKVVPSAVAISNALMGAVAFHSLLGAARR